MIEGKWKLLLTYDGELGRYANVHPRTEKRPQLYDLEADPAVEITIDLVSKRVRSSTGLDFGFTMPESARDALVAGRWDPIQELLDREADIATKAKELHYV